MAYQKYKLTNISGDQFEKSIDFINNSVAEPFDSLTTYNYSDYVMYNYKLYMCISQNPVVGEWDSSKWEEHRIFDNDIIFIRS